MKLLLLESYRTLAAMLLIVLMTLLPAASVNAQSEDTWYFGWNNESGQLVGYTLDGQRVELLTIDPDVQPRSWRIGPQRIVAVLSVEGSTGLYQLTPDGATPITPSSGAQGVIPQIAELSAQSDNYAVLVAQDGAFSTGILVDLTANTAELLSGESLTPIENWRFSADGTTLRYMTRQSRESSDWNLWARSLNSGDELNLHNFSSQFPNVQSSPNGDLWLYNTLDSETRLVTYTIIDANGNTQVLNEETVPENAADRAAYQLIGSDLLIYRAPCQTDCTITRQSLAGEVAATYQLPAIPSPQITVLADVEGSRPLILADTVYYLLSPTEEAVRFGTYNAANLATAPDGLTSPDGLWQIVLDESGANFQLWAVPVNTLAWEGAITSRTEVQYERDGVFVTGFEPRQTLYYQFGDAESFELPHAESDFYIDGLGDGTFLYTQTAIAEGRPPGVYRYNTADGVYILLEQNLFPLQTQ